MANPNLGQDVANKRERYWPNLIPYSKLQECVVTVLFLTSNSLILRKAGLVIFPPLLTKNFFVQNSGYFKKKKKENFFHSCSSSSSFHLMQD